MSAESELPYPEDDPATVGQLVLALAAAGGRLQQAVGKVRASEATVLGHWKNGEAAPIAVTRIGLVIADTATVASSLLFAQKPVGRYRAVLTQARTKVDELRGLWTEAERAFVNPPPEETDPATARTQAHNGLRQRYQTEVVAVVDKALTKVAGELQDLAAHRVFPLQ